MINRPVINRPVINRPVINRPVINRPVIKRPVIKTSRTSIRRCILHGFSWYTITIRRPIYPA